MPRSYTADPMRYSLHRSRRRAVAQLFNGAGSMQMSVKVRAKPKGESRQHAGAAAERAPLRQVQTQCLAKLRVSGDRVRTARPARRRQTTSGGGQYRCSRPPNQHLPGTRDPRFPFPTGSSDQFGDANSRGASRVPGPSTCFGAQSYGIPDGISQSECETAP